MNVQLKITLLLLALVAAFVAAVGAIKTHEDRQLARLTEVRTRDSELSFDKRVVKESEPLAVLAKDFSAWDDMVLAVAQGDDKWLEKNVGPVELAQSDANAIWIFDLAGRRVHAVNNLYSDKPWNSHSRGKPSRNSAGKGSGTFTLPSPTKVGWRSAPPR